MISKAALNFYPRPPGGGRPDAQLQRINDGIKISIHALRVEGDGGGVGGTVQLDHFYPRPPGGGRLIELGLYPAPDYISIHALRVEGDMDAMLYSTNTHPFLSTPSGWRATTADGQAGKTARKFLSTPSGWRATTPDGDPVYYNVFLSTPSGWRATGVRHKQSERRHISIHALRVEGD